MTIVVANATYENLPTSGMLDYLDMEQRARVCISNRCAAVLTPYK